MNDLKETLWSRVEEHEAEIVKEHIRLGPPIKVGKLAEALGLRVTRSPALQARISGLIRPAGDTPSGFEILVNKYEPLERQRFTVAHEIGHFLLHKNEIGAGVIDSIMYRSSLSSRKEVEANRIAALILMPATAVSERLLELGGLDEPGAIEELAEVFRVSEPAMRIRLGAA